MDRQRLVDKKEELGAKLERLLNCIEANNMPDVFGSLPENEQALISMQFDAMQTYSFILGERITLPDSATTE